MRQVLQGAAASVFVLCALAAAAHADDWERAYAVTRTTQLKLTTGDARVVVHPGPRDQVRMHIHTNGLSIGHRLAIEVDQTPGAWTARVRERPHWFGFTIDFDLHPRVIVDLEVPADCQLQVATGDGGIEADGVGGRVDLHTGDGGIRVQNLRGEVMLDTGDGGVEAHAIDGRLTAHSGDGGLHLDGRFDELDVSSGDGSVDLAVNSGSRVASAWSVRTGDGGVRLRLPRDLKADLHAHTGDGGIRLDIPVEVSGEFGHHDLHGALNGGGGPLEVRSGDGSIHIMAS